MKVNYAQTNTHTRPCWFGQDTLVNTAFKPVIEKFARDILTRVDVTNFFNSVDAIARDLEVPGSLRKHVVHECCKQAKANRHG